MSKKITPNQLLGEIGEAAVRLRFLTMGFQFDGRSRLEAGVDGIAEVMDNGKPLARMIAVQIKATESSRYATENESSFTYLVRPDDLEYWRPSNLPVILVLYRKSDNTYFWKQVDAQSSEDRRLKIRQDYGCSRRQRGRSACSTYGAEGRVWILRPATWWRRRGSRQHSTRDIAS